jgi:hypothetical protein
VIGERAGAQGRQKNDSRKSQSGDRREDPVIGDDSSDANGSKTVWCAQWCGGGTYGGDPQSGCSDDGAGGGAEKAVTPDP